MIQRPNWRSALSDSASTAGASGEPPPASSTMPARSSETREARSPTVTSSHSAERSVAVVTGVTPSSACRR
ncbi:hypothetical protein G7085_03065 [Tessaracoccus sp. HDW20]|uniref:hypothetical protein n=1 Tax=Tessaracoccus coleopterorum TaxID=2714950 RepID=UPI0018D29AED|nr:hypothetical protein [Tessaracoccus coleopterorum]NHB83988.1 hypothetical protein [Tessaracoccus coleopterorum]